MDNEFQGMTVNERLFVSGLMDDFDKAIEEKNVEKVISILKKVEFSEESINPILKNLNLV